MTIADEIHALFVHHTGLPIVHLIDEIHALDLDHAPIQETDPSPNTLRHWTKSF